MNLSINESFNDLIIDSIASSLSTVKKNPDKEEFASNTIQMTLNNTLKGCNCEKVYFTKGNDVDGNPVIVIPKMVTNVLKTRTLTDYSIEINTSLYGCPESYSVDEVALLIIHDIIENIISDNTFMRFKNLLTKYMSKVSLNAYNNSRIRSLSSLLWISIFSRTKKEIITNTSSSFFIEVLKKHFSDTYVEIWNNAVRKFININGGDPNIISGKAVKYKDKSDLLTFNKFAREYTSDEHCKYPGDYTRTTKYILAGSNSKLLANSISAEPLFSGEFPGKDIYEIFDDTKVIYEAVDCNMSTLGGCKRYLQTFNELELDVRAVETDSEKLEAAVKLRAFNLEITKALETDIANKEVLQSLRSKTNDLIRKLKSINTTHSVNCEFA